jgi:peptide/nickel transport system substrate-binding protein
VVEHVLGKVVRLERNPGYFPDSPKPAPQLREVEIRFIPDAQTRVAETVAGGLDLIMYVAPDQANQLRTIPSLQIIPGETLRYSYLILNTTDRTPSPPLLDLRVRRAIMHAIDREAIAKYLAVEGTAVLHADCHPRQFGCVASDVPRYDYDPDRAKRLLADAGLSAGFDIDIHASWNRNETEAIIGYLRAVGIRARLRFLQSAALMSALGTKTAALTHMYWGSSSIGDVSASVSAFHDFSAFDVNRDDEVRDLLARGDSSMDEEARKAAYARALSLISERAYVLPLYSVPIYYAAAQDLVFRPTPDEIPRFYEMSWK